MQSLSFVAIQKNYVGKLSAEKKDEQIMIKYP